VKILKDFKTVAYMKLKLFLYLTEYHAMKIYSVFN